jgi:hypothetical protein
MIIGKALDPDSLNPDPDRNPDPAFQVNPDPIRIQDFDDQKQKRKKQLKLFYPSFIKNCILLMSKLQEKPSALKTEHTAQKMKFINFFLSLWVIFALLHMDPDTDSGTPLNPDPQH